MFTTYELQATHCSFSLNLHRNKCLLRANFEILNIQIIKWNLFHVLRKLNAFQRLKMCILNICVRWVNALFENVTTEKSKPNSNADFVYWNGKHIHSLSLAVSCSYFGWYIERCNVSVWWCRPIDTRQNKLVLRTWSYT